MATADGLTARAHAPGRREAVGVGMYLLAALLFAFNGVLAKAAMNAGLDPLHLTQLRNAGAMAVLVVWVAIRYPHRFRIRRGEIGFLIAYGLIAFTLVQFLYFFTISRLPVGIGTLLAFLAPVVVAIWAKLVMKADVAGRIWLGIALTLAGLALVAQVWQGLTLDPIGLAAGLLLAFALAAYWILGERGQQERDSVSLTMYGFVFATAGWFVISPWWNFPFDTLGLYAGTLPGTRLDVPVWVLMAWGIVMGTVVTFLLVLGSLRRIGAQRAGIVATTEPLWAGIIALALLGETFSPMQGVGGLIVLAGVIVAETSRVTDVTPQAAPPTPER